MELRQLPAPSAVLDEALRLAEQQPERNAACVYLQGPQPCCIIGQALHNLGVPHSLLREMDDLNMTPIELWIVEPGSPEHDAVRLLSNIQGRQDNGVPWGQAVL